MWLAYRCEQLTAKTAKVEATQRDGKVWRDDSVEFYCDPHCVGLEFMQFTVNAAGVIYDGNREGGEWNADFEALAATDATGYTVAMRIPFKSMDVHAPKPGDAWRVNFARHGPGDMEDSSSWAWAYNTLQSPPQFGELIFGDTQRAPIRMRAVAPFAMGSNKIELDSAAGLACRVVQRDASGTVMAQTSARATGNAFSFTLQDDAVRSIELRLEDAQGRLQARSWSAVTTAQLTGRLADWLKRLESMKHTSSRFPASLRDQSAKATAETAAGLGEAQRIVADRPAYAAETWQKLGVLLDSLDQRFGDLSAYARTLEHFPDAAFAVGLESPMRKVLIRDHPFEGWFARQARVSLAANEHEAIQVVVIPHGRDLKNVRVTAPDNAEWRKAGIRCQVSVVGHVDVNDDPPYEAVYKGLWPDPLLDFLPSADIRSGEHVAFWVDVISAKDSPPGEFGGVIQVAADGCPPIELALTVRVWNFRLPDGTHLKNAFTYNEPQIHGIYKGKWSRELAYKYYDIVLDHRLGIDHLYRHGPPDLDLLKYAVSKGMNAFNIIFTASGGNRDNVIKALNEFVPRLRKEGLFDLAYLYGFDEVKKDKFEAAREIFGEVHRRAPGIPTMTTAQDPSFGRQSGLREAVDIWVPLTPGYDLAEAKQLRREGKQMWWYICLVPIHPYANWFVEYPAIESRLLMGAMSYKYQVDGFLYYLINNGWERNRKVISSGPITEWDPASCPNSKGKWANGDGNLIYPGPDGPLSTIRLENIRDGLEDYEYLYLLAESVRRVAALPATPARREFLASARTLLEVPDTVVRSVVEFTTDVDALQSWRDQLAELVVAGAALTSK